MHRLLLLISLLLTAADESSRIVVTFRSASFNTETIVDLVPENITVVKQYGRRLVLLIGMDSDSTDFIADALGGSVAVERIETDSLVDASDFNETDSEMLAASEALPTPWHLDPSEPYGLHLTSSLMSKNASVVAILDSGLASVAAAVWRPLNGYCFISSPDYTNTNLGRNPDFTDPGDQGPTCPTPSWHGTKTASIIKAVAPSSKLSILRVLGRCGTGFASDVTDAIVWAAGGGINGVRANPFPAKVVSMSLAGKGPCPTYMQSAVNQAITLGATLIAAAGNAGANATLYFPGNCKGVLSIGASTRQGTLAPYSNWGETLAFSAPGGDAANPVQVTTVGWDGVLAIGYVMGTSFAAPHVAGVALMLQAANISLADGGRYIPFAQCDAPICGRILSYYGVNQSVSNPIVQASGTCSGILGDGIWAPVQAGSMHGGDTDNYHYCNSPCYVTSFIVCDKNGGWRSIQIQCSDGNYSPRFGYQGTCDGSTGGTATSALGFTGIKAYAGSDINGVEIRAIGGVTTSYGCSNCQTTYDVQCGTTPDGQKRVVTGVQHSYDTQYVHTIKLLCYTRRCAAGFWYDTGVNDCVDCSRCGGGAYALGCGGSSAGSCTPCVNCPVNQYQAGCGGTYGGTCAECTRCSAGNSFSGCVAGGTVNNFQCTSCDIGKYGGGGYTACTPCGAEQFTTSKGSVTYTACTVCADGYYENLPCTTTQNRQCAVCGPCDPNQYRSDCTPTSSGGSCSNCQLCPAGKYLSGCAGRQPGSCLPCSPANYFCLGNYNIPTAWKVTTCAAGSYLSSPPSTTADGVCSPCGITNYCAGGTVSRTICPAGWFCSTDGATKTQCPPGSYCGEGSTTQTNCGAGYYSATLGAASISTCLACDAGKFAPTTGSTACTLCGIGSYSGGVAFSRCTDCTDLLNYQDFQGQIACKPCTTTTCAAGTSTQICTKYTDKSCTSCTPIANCKYSGNLCTDAISGKPACACAAGYQMAAAAPYICLQCPYGTFKSIESSTPCTPWTDRSSCAFTTLGTRITDSACVVFPLPPDNAVAVSDGWRCNAGYEKAL